MEPEDIRAALTALRGSDVPTRGGRTLAYVYDSGLDGIDRLAAEAHRGFAHANGLDPTAFPGVMQMENDLVGMGCDLLHAPPSAVGTVTSGGTESILLAVQGARDSRPDVGAPNMVLPVTAHPSFHKAAHYFRVRPVFIDVDPVTKRADPSAMVATITSDTVLVVASAPSYAHGVVDPVGPVAAAAAARGVRCHVDACIGGWVLPFLAERGDDVAPWDFAVDGVTSVSVDLHKYAYTPKGAALLLHRDAALRRPQHFASANWPGYAMLNSTTQSTRSGGPIAAAWAVTRAIGRDGYAGLAGRVRDAVLAVTDGIAGIDHLDVVAAPDSTLLAVQTDGACDVFSVCDEMAARGWYVQPQLSYRSPSVQWPPSMHLSLSAASAARVPELLVALGESARAACASGPIPVPDGLRAAAASLDPDTLDDAAFDGLLELAGLANDGELALPDRMATVNALLDVATPALREALLLAFLDRLARPSRP
jgi:glutamate/tyrosine decarboxylase-like PLP-dependent enzyme